MKIKNLIIYYELPSLRELNIWEGEDIFFTVLLYIQISKLQKFSRNLKYSLLLIDPFAILE